MSAPPDAARFSSRSIICAEGSRITVGEATISLGDVGTIGTKLLLNFFDQSISTGVTNQHVVTAATIGEVRICELSAICHVIQAAVCFQIVIGPEIIIARSAREKVIAQTTINNIVANGENEMRGRKSSPVDRGPPKETGQAFLNLGLSP